MAKVPVLVLTGPVGVGKTTTALAASWVLAEAGVRSAVVDLPQVSHLYPAPQDDEWNERIAHANLGAMWANFREAGAERLTITRVLEGRSLLRRIEAVVPNASITVVRLRAPMAVVEERIMGRDPEPEWYLTAARRLVDSMERGELADFVIENASRSPRETAEEALRLVGWLS